MNNNKNEKPERGEPRRRPGSDNYDRRPIVDPPTDRHSHQAAETVSAKRKGFYIILLLGITAIGIYAVLSALMPNDTAKKNDDKKSSASAVYSTAAPKAESVPANANGLPIDESEPIPADEADSKVKATETPSNTQGSQNETQTPSLGQAPVSGRIVKDFSDSDLTYSKTMKDWRTHAGVDIAANMDTPVTVIKDGTLKKVYEDSLFGTTVVVHHDDDGTDSIYSNLKDATNEPIGTPLKKGDLVGKIGKTAVSEIEDEPHLHFEIKLDDTFLDPKQFVKFEEVDYVPKATEDNESAATLGSSVSAAPSNSQSSASVPASSTDPYDDYDDEDSEETIYID